jgi:hypothetical protein
MEGSSKMMGAFGFSPKLRSGTGLGSFATIILVSLLILTGCSGGDDDPQAASQSQAQPIIPPKVFLSFPYGLWRGTAKDSLDNELPVRFFVFDDQISQIEIGPKPVAAITSNFVAAASAWFTASTDQCCVFRNNVSAIASERGQPDSIASIAATFNGGVSGTVTRGSARYEFTATRDMSEPVLLSNPGLAGVYAGNFSSYANSPKGWTLTIETDGRVTGSDAYGCSWSGSSAFNGINANLFKLTLAASGCAPDPLAPANGSYTALGRYFAASASHPRYPGQAYIDFSLVGAKWLGSQQLAR